MAKKTSKKTRKSHKGGLKTTPTPQVLQRASQLVLSGKCPVSKPTFLKLKKHRNILRKLAAMKGKSASKKAFVTRHKKQVGGFIQLLPLIATAIGSLVPTLLGGLKRR